MNRTFVASTIYHIYLSLLYILKNADKNKNRGNNLLFIIESTPQIDTLIPALKKSFFREVTIISSRKHHRKEIGKFNYTFNRKSKLPSYLEKKHPILEAEKSFIENSELFLCNCDSSKSYFMYAFPNKEIHMIEDGARTYVQEHRAIEGIVKKHITKTPIGGGFDANVKSLYAQFPNKLPKKLQHKAMELNIKKEVSTLDETTKLELFNIFLPNTELQIQESVNTLILTQPISEDGVVADEETKIKIYKDIITKLPNKNNIYLKVHPRERTNYEEHFPNITVLPALFPIEILSLKKGFQFKYGYTLFSTALSNLEIVEERFFLGKEYLNKFTSKATKELIINMSVD